MQNIKKNHKMKVEVVHYSKMMKKVEFYFYNWYWNVFIIGLLNIQKILRIIKVNIKNIIKIWINKKQIGYL